MRHVGHPQSAATRAKISRSLKGRKRLTTRQKADNISRRARERHKAGKISREELNRRLKVSGKVRNPTPANTHGRKVEPNDLHSAIANILAKSEHSQHAAAHHALAKKIRPK